MSPAGHCCSLSSRSTWFRYLAPGLRSQVILEVVHRRWSYCMVWIEHPRLKNFGIQKDKNQEQTVNCLLRSGLASTFLIQTLEHSHRNQLWSFSPEFDTVLFLKQLLHNSNFCPVEVESKSVFEQTISLE